MNSIVSKSAASLSWLRSKLICNHHDAGSGGVTWKDTTPNSGLLVLHHIFKAVIWTAK